MGGNGDLQFQQPISTTIAANGVSRDLTSYNTATSIIQLSGTWVGTLIVEGSNNGANYFTLPMLSRSSSLYVGSMTANGIYLANTNGYQFIRVTSTAWTSGTATITVYGSDAASLIATDAILRGATDGAQIGNLGDRLKVDANFTVLGGQLVPTITNKLRVRYSTTPATAGAAYSTIYTRSGTGLFFGFQCDFNSANVRLRLTIDSGQIFEITISDVKLFQFNDTSTTRMQMGGFWATVGNTVDFSTKYAIPYTTSITLEMQRSDGTNHSMSQYMVLLTEDT